MQRSLTACLLMICLSGTQVLARPSDDDGSERARLRRQQQELEARHAERLAECAKRFEVNKCRNKALAEHRASLAPLLERERSLDEEARTNRALLQSLRTSARQSGEAASAPAARSAARPASHVLTDRPTNRDAAALAARRAAQLQKDQDQAAERARQSRERQAALDAHAKAVQERNARRSGKPANSLPVPTAASIAALPPASSASR